MLVVTSTLLVVTCMTVSAFFHRRWFKDQQYADDVSRIAAHQADYALTVLTNQGM